MVARVAVAALVALGKRRIGFEIRAGQVVQQHVEACVEQIPPAPDQVIEQRLLVRQQAVMTGVELVDLGQREVAPSKSASALRSNHARCNRHSLPGASNR